MRGFISGLEKSGSRFKPFATAGQAVGGEMKRRKGMVSVPKPPKMPRM